MSRDFRPFFGLKTGFAKFSRQSSLYTTKLYVPVVGTMLPFFTRKCILIHVLDDTEKPADGGLAEGGGGLADGGLVDELKAMSLDSGSSTDADVDSDSGTVWFVFDFLICLLFNLDVPATHKGGGRIRPSQANICCLVGRAKGPMQL